MKRTLGRCLSNIMGSIRFPWRKSQLPEALKIHLQLLLWVAFGVTSLWLVSGTIVYLVFSSWTDRGTFGDMFGAINSLFSGLALAGIIIAIILQSQELEYQRQELRQTRQELARTAKAQEESRDALTKQAQLLEVTAYLNALTAVIQSYEQRMGRDQFGTAYKKSLEPKQEEYIKILEEHLLRFQKTAER